MSVLISYLSIFKSANIKILRALTTKCNYWRESFTFHPTLFFSTMTKSSALSTSPTILPIGFCEDIQLNSIGIWALSMINNHPTRLNVLTCWLCYVGRQFGGTPIYFYPHHHNNEQTSSVVSYIRHQLRHRDDVDTGNSIR